MLAIAFMKAKKGKIQNINYPDIANDSEIKKGKFIKGYWRQCNRS